MRTVLCLQVQTSSEVPSLGALLVSCSFSRQSTLQALSGLLTEKLENGSCASFPYKTIQGRNIPREPTTIQIWAISPPNQKTGPVFSLPNVVLSPVPFCCVRLRLTNVSCTPERLNAARVPWHTCSLNANTVTHQTRQNISFKKTFKMLKRWATIRAVEQVNPTAQNTCACTSALLFLLFKED